MTFRAFLIVVLLIASSAWSQESGVDAKVSVLDARYKTRVSRQLADSVIRLAPNVGYSVEVSGNGNDTLVKVINDHRVVTAIAFNSFGHRADSCWVFSDLAKNPLFDSTVVFSEISIEVKARHK